VLHTVDTNLGPVLTWISEGVQWWSKHQLSPNDLELVKQLKKRRAE
jgi:hypothetical protein